MNARHGFCSASGMRRLLAAGAAVLLVTAGAAVLGYPLDGRDETGIARLEGYLNAQQRPTGAKLPPGALLGTDDIRLRLVGRDVADFDAAPPDPQLQSSLNRIFRDRDPSYAVVVVDISDPHAVRWAGLRPDVRQNVGSVGKIITMAGLFHVLRETYPDIEQRKRILSTTVARAGPWVLAAEHDVPRFDRDTGTNRFSRLRADDEFLLSEWLDHAISASANGAAAVVWREAMLMRHFGRNYPVSWSQSEAFFRETPKHELTELALSISEAPLREAGLVTANIRQGSFWTGNSKAIVPGTSSFATPRELARFMYRLEQGRIVDEWSSLEMKKYMYLTKRRYRYVYAPELAEAATFFKSGSLYSCQPEEGFRCGKYMGNVRNYMNSVVTIEHPASRDPELVYVSALISNVLRFNSAWDHSRFAAAIHEALQTPGSVNVRESATPTELSEAGRSD